MTSIKEVLNNTKRNLSENSFKTYNSILKNLLSKLNSDDINIFINDSDKVINELMKIEPNKRKTILSAIIVLLESFDNKDKIEDVIKKYRLIMLDDIDKVKEQLKKQTKSINQNENWMSYDNILKIYNNLENDVKHLFKKTSINDNEYQELQNYVILSCYILIHPRRLLDWSEMKKINYDVNKDNYIDLKNKKFVFNKYKTSKFYGKQEVDIPKKLFNIIKKFIKYNNNQSDYLFIDFNKNQLTPTKLNQRLNKIFNKKIGVSMLRHIYISDNVLKDMPKLEKLENIARDMGHNVNQQILYKKD